eukprot:13845406-Ditylum_brightwellii.AAC.1
MTIGNTSELGDKDKLNAEPGQIVKTPSIPLFPASVTASATGTYSLNQDTDGISDGTDDGISDGIDDGISDGTDDGISDCTDDGNVFNDTALGTCDSITLNVGLAVVLNAKGTWDSATLSIAVKVKA